MLDQWLIVGEALAEARDGPALGGWVATGGSHTAYVSRSIIARNRGCRAPRTPFRVGRGGQRSGCLPKTTATWSSPRESLRATKEPPTFPGELSRPSKNICELAIGRLGLRNSQSPPMEIFLRPAVFRSSRDRIERAAVSEEEVIGFIREHIGSVYTLDLLLLVKRDRHRSWSAGDLVRELRSSETAVMEALSRMNRAGLVAQNSDGRFAFAPVSARHEQLAAEIEKAYNSTPMSVVKAIIALPEEKLRAFSAAFKLKE